MLHAGALRLQACAPQCSQFTLVGALLKVCRPRRHADTPALASGQLRLQLLHATLHCARIGPAGRLLPNAGIKLAGIPYSPTVQGPVNVHDSVIRAMSVPGQNHRDPWFAEFYKQVRTRRGPVLGTQAASDQMKLVTHALAPCMRVMCSHFFQHGAEQRAAA